MAKFWHLDTIIEQIRLDEIRVGKFRIKYKVNLREFIAVILKKLNFAIDAGSELAEKGDSSPEINYYKSVKCMFDAWVDPRIEQYFQQNPMHETVDMRQFGKLFAGKKLQIVVEDAAHKKCLFAMLITVSQEGIESIRTSKKPTFDYDFLLRADLKTLYMDSTLSRTAQLKKILHIFSHGEVRLSGLRTFFKLILYGIKEAISFRLNHSGV